MGIAVCVAAMVILLSAFNGIEHMVSKLYTAFDAPLTIQHKNRKTFFISQLDLKTIQQVKGLKYISKEREELVVLRKNKRWINANLHAVDHIFIREAKVKNHLINGFGSDRLNQENTVFLGAEVFSKLKLGLGSEQNDIAIYAPKNNLRLRPGSSPFKTASLDVAGALNYNQELNGTVLLCNLNLVAALFDQPKALSRLNIYLEPGANEAVVQEQLKKITGANFNVKTQFEKNELIYKTSKSERLVVFIILLFVFVLASFNLIAALTMLTHEKRENLSSMKAMGMSAKERFMVFFLEGQLLVVFGVSLGLCLGLIICWSQQTIGWLVVPGANVPFPIVFQARDFLYILLASSVLGFIFTYFPLRILLNKSAQ